MSLAVLFTLGGGEVALILALIPILLLYLMLRAAWKRWRLRRLQATALRFAKVAPEILQDEFTLACCIPAASIAVELLRQRGFSGRVVPVTLQFLGPEFLELERKLGRFPSGTEAKEANAGHVIIGYGTPPPEAWSGHLVAVVENRVLVDFATSQASDEHARFLAPTFIIQSVPRTWFNGNGEVRLGLEDGWQARYIHRRDLYGTWNPAGPMERSRQEMVTRHILAAISTTGIDRSA